jgi:hypothetical protein
MQACDPARHAPRISAGVRRKQASRRQGLSYQQRIRVSKPHEWCTVQVQHSNMHTTCKHSTRCNEPEQAELRVFCSKQRSATCNIAAHRPQCPNHTKSALSRSHRRCSPHSTHPGWMRAWFMQCPIADFFLTRGGRLLQQQQEMNSARVLSVGAGLSAWPAISHWSPSALPT